MAIKKAEEKHTKYPCGKCGKKPNIGDDLYITKVNDKWVSCIDPNCFKSQGGKIEDPNDKSKFFKGGTNYKKPEDCNDRLTMFHEYIIMNATQTEVIDKLVSNGICKDKQEGFKLIMDYSIQAFLGEIKTNEP